MKVVPAKDLNMNTKYSPLFIFVIYTPLTNFDVSIYVEMVWDKHRTVFADKKFYFTWS